MGRLGLLLGWRPIFHHIILGETIDAVKLLMANPEATTRDIMEVMPGPDFPTGALVMGRSGIHRAYETGKGSITLTCQVRD
jgi:DNA gyrase subunit A